MSPCVPSRVLLYSLSTFCGYFFESLGSAEKPGMITPPSSLDLLNDSYAHVFEQVQGMQKANRGLEKNRPRPFHGSSHWLTYTCTFPSGQAMEISATFVPPNEGVVCSLSCFSRSTDHSRREVLYFYRLISRSFECQQDEGMLTRLRHNKFLALLPSCLRNKVVAV